MDSFKFERSLGEFYTILLEEHLQVDSEMLEVGICSSFYPPKLTSGSMMFKSGDYAGQGRCWSSVSCSSNHD
jgi:hypothetical protein